MLASCSVLSEPAFTLVMAGQQRGSRAGCDAGVKAAWHSMTDLNDRWKSWCMGCTWLWRAQGDVPSLVKKKRNYSSCGLTLILLNSDTDV